MTLSEREAELADERRDTFENFGFEIDRIGPEPLQCEQYPHSGGPRRTHSFRMCCQTWPNLGPVNEF